MTFSISRIVYLLSVQLLLSAAVVSAQPLECQRQMDQELTRSGLPDLDRASAIAPKSTKAIDASAFKRNEVGQYPAYAIAEDDFSKTLVGELIHTQSDGKAPADGFVTLGDSKSPVLTYFLSDKRIVGYSAGLSKDGIGKAVLFSPRCEPKIVKLVFPSSVWIKARPIIDLNRSDCSRLPDLEAIAGKVEIDENERIFDGLCRVRGGSVTPEAHGGDDDIVCECKSGSTIDPELENWFGKRKTCLDPTMPAYADVFAALISSKSSFVNGGFQAMVSQLKKPNSVFAQQCASYFH